MDMYENVPSRTLTICVARYVGIYLNIIKTNTVELVCV